MRVLVIAMIMSTAVAAQELPPEPTDLTLGWTIPTELQGGGGLPVTDIAGYELYTTCSPDPVEVLDASQESITLPIDTSLSCDWQISAVHVNGTRSERSNAVTVEFAVPAAPVLRRVSF